MINQRKSPIQDEYIEKYLAEKELDLTATLDAEHAYKNADFVVIAAPTVWTVIMIQWHETKNRVHLGADRNCISMIENNSKCLAICRLCLAICRLCRLTMSKDGYIILLSNSVLYNYGTFGGLCEGWGKWRFDAW